MQRKKVHISINNNHSTTTQMARKIPFTKMHGAGNDYIYVDTCLHPIDDPHATAIQWSDRHKGIGSDGLVLIGRADTQEADFSMRIFNADGSEAMMCGNASRCIGKYLFEKGMTNNTNIRLQTRSGIKTLNLHLSGFLGEEWVESVTVDMLQPRLTAEEQFTGSSKEDTLTADGTSFTGTFVSMGNPHFVIFTDDVDAIDVSRYGRLLERHPVFPERCNIEFAQITGENRVRTRVWERGSGITMACGTGACATAVAASVTGRTGRQCQVVMDGGTLSIDWQADNHVYMTGPAAFSFEGEAELP